LRIDAANKSHNNTIIARDSGLVSITNSSQMAEAYKEYLGVEVSEEEVGARIESDFKSLIEEETGMSYDEFEDMVKDVSDVYGVNSVVAGSLITSVGLAATGGIKLNTDDFTEEEKKAINESKIAAGDTPEEFGDIIATKKEPTDTVVDIQETLTGSLNSNGEQIIDQIVEEDDSFVEEVSEEVVSEPNAIVPPVQEESSSPVIAEVDEKPPVELDSYDKVVVSDDVADDIKDKIGDLAEANPPEELEKEKVTSEDVDNQARDEYYASKTPDQLASDRNKAIEEFDKMPTEVKVKAIEGMGFAIPIEFALSHVNTLENGEKIKWPVLGIGMINAVDRAKLARYNLSIPDDVKEGVVIQSIKDGSASKNANLKKGDIIIKINKVSIKDIAHLKYELYKYQSKDKIEITYIRNQKEKSIKVTLD